VHTKQYNLLEEFKHFTQNCPHPKKQMFFEIPRFVSIKQKKNVGNYDDP